MKTTRNFSKYNSNIAQIQTRYFSNTSLGCYCHTNLLNADRYIQLYGHIVLRLPGKGQRIRITY